MPVCTSCGANHAEDSVRCGSALKREVSPLPAWVGPVPPLPGVHLSVSPSRGPVQDQQTHQSRVSTPGASAQLPFVALADADRQPPLILPVASIALPMDSEFERTESGRRVPLILAQTEATSVSAGAPAPDSAAMPPRTRSASSRAIAATVELGTAPLPLTAAQMTPQSRSRAPLSIVGAYRLISLLGEGGMGRVYLAEHVKLGRRVALKMLRSEYASNPSAVRRFFDEARAVNQIKHENIIEVTDFVEGENGSESYFIMELLIGTDLGSLQSRAPIGLLRTLHIANQMCSALAAAHAAGIVHRDLKPENVFIVSLHGDAEFVKLLDFGVAKLADPLHEESTRTQAGAILGTPEYMSPEQAGGTPVDQRTDIYAFGVMLYEMVTGRRPFSGRSFGEYVVAHLSVAPPHPSQLSRLPQPVPSSFERLILKCLAKSPEARPQSMLELGAELKLLAAEITGVAQPQRPLRGRTHRSRAVGVALGVMAVTVGALAFTPRVLARRSRDVAALATMPPPAAAQRVRVSFDSSPRGAEVYREGSEEALGLTPLEWATDRSEQPARFEFRFPGRERAWQEIRLNQDSSVSVALAALPAATLPSPGLPVEALPLTDQRQSPAPAAAAVRLVPPSTLAPTRRQRTPAHAVEERDQALDRDAVADPFAK